MTSDWRRRLALLALVLCTVLPLGAIGAVDANYPSLTPTPLPRASRPGGHRYDVRTSVDHHSRSSFHASIAALPDAAPGTTAVASFEAAVELPPVARTADDPSGTPGARGPPSSR